jgi:virulence factor Mce-like protein
MRANSPLQSVLRNPTLVGAITVLVVVLAVFLAYNANSGLPFVATYRVTAEVPNAASLVPGNEVRIGGVRVGLVEDVVPITEEDGGVKAGLVMKLDKSVEPIPEDSTVVIRARSALGLKYLEINRGTSEEGYPEGATIPVSQAKPTPVEYDELLNTFDTPTREAIKVNLAEFGSALAGRGSDLNEAIGILRPLLPRLERVTRNLSSSDTDLAGFVDGLSQSAAAVAPIAETQAQMFVNLDRAVGAFAEVARPYLQETITRTPETLAVTTATAPNIRTFLVNNRLLINDFGPGAEALATTGPQIEAALRAGIPALRTSPELNSQLAPTAASVRALADDPTSRTGIDRLTEFGNELSPPLRFIGPSQSVCNYWSLLFRNLNDSLGEGNPLGTWARAIPLETPAGPNNEGSPSSAPANGGTGSDEANFLHANPYPNTAAPGQTFECESGNDLYLVGEQSIGNQPGNQGTVTEDQIKGQAEGKAG